VIDGPNNIVAYTKTLSDTSLYKPDKLGGTWGWTQTLPAWLQCTSTDEGYFEISLNTSDDSISAGNYLFHFTYTLYVNDNSYVTSFDVNIQIKDP
jgi:hypothetical protein